MPLQALKTDEEIAGIPLDQPILIELPGGTVEEPEKPEKPEKTQAEQTDPDAKALLKQLEAAQAAQRVADDRAIKAERLAAEKDRQAQEALSRSQSLEGDIITGGLAAAQTELASAEAELERAGEAGDFKAMAKAQTRIGRASAQVVSLESNAAEIAERPKPEVVRQEIQRPDPIAAIDLNPNLLPAEREWLKAHPDAVLDPKRNNELGVGYERAIAKGFVRGTPQYLSFLEDFMGYAKPSTDNNGGGDVQAPVSRNERGGDGRPSPNKVTLSPEQRKTAAELGVSETAYARGYQKFEAARRADPDRYSDR